MDEWEDDQENPKWYIEYPLIKKYEDWEEWDNNKTTKYENEEYLRKIPCLS
jgi:hypothetical protein